MKKRIHYWSFHYMPEWEAASKEVESLFTEINGDDWETTLMAMNLKRRRLALKGREKHLPLPWGLGLLPGLKSYASKFDIHHIYASLSEPLLLPRLKGPRTILTAAKDDASLARVEKNLPHLKELAAVVVESDLHREYLLQCGMDPDRVQCIFPGKEPRPYVKAEDPFTILFATSPRGRHDFLARGVHLMVQTAKQLPEVKFLLAWRKANLEQLMATIEENGLQNIEVRDGPIKDMDALYDAAHATILPGLTPNSIKPCPHSALDSLAHGKPVLVSRPMSISSLVQKHQCGIVFEPVVEDLIQAIRTLQSEYPHYQANAHTTIQSDFSPQEFLSRYRKLYEAISTR